MVDWYEQRDTLLPGQVFKCQDGSVVMLDRRVPGDGTQWYVADDTPTGWYYGDNKIEPGELCERLPELEGS